jgi:hypothetical protein
MSRRRVTVLLAIMAALAGAPSSVSAAAPNALSEATVLPASGDTSTLFFVTVRYSSPAGNPTTGVTVQVGAHQANLALISGTTTDGIWSGTITAAPGSWDVTVQAAVAKGPQPSVLAGSIIVAGEPQPPASPSDGGPPSFGSGSGGDGGAIPSTPAPAPVTPPPTVTVATPAPARSSSEPDPPLPPTHPAPGVAAVGPGRGGEGPTRTPRPEPAGSDDPAPQSPDASATVGAFPGPVGGNDDLSGVLFWGMLGVVAVALAGSAWIFLAVRRDRRAAAAAAGAPPTDPGVIAAAIVEQRALRRARLRSSDDPILAAMGLPDEDSTSGVAPLPRQRTRRTRARRRPPAP